MSVLSNPDLSLLKKVLLVIMAVICSSLSQVSPASEPIINKNCKTCHGLDGIAKTESWPHLACQNRGYLYIRMLALRHSNDHSIDDRIKSLSLKEIDAISQYYAEQKCPPFR